MPFKRPDDSWLDVLAKISTTLTFVVVVFTYFYTVKPVFDKQKLEQQVAELKSDRAIAEAALLEAERKTIKTMIVQILNSVGYSVMDKSRPELLYAKVKKFVAGERGKYPADKLMNEALFCIEEYLSRISPEEYERYGAVSYFSNVYWTLRPKG